MHAKKFAYCSAEFNQCGCLRSTRALLAGVSAQYFRTLKPLRTALFATDELMFRSWFLGTACGCY